MDMNAFFSKLRIHTGFHVKEKSEKEFVDDCDEKDDMDGDFVILKEITDVPVISSDGLPSYSGVMTEQYQKQPPPPSYPAMKINTECLDDPEANPYNSAISDIPFQFHPNLCVQQRLHSIFHGLDLETHHFNWSKYSHDFKQEKLCLRDFNEESSCSYGSLHYNDR